MKKEEKEREYRKIFLTFYITFIGVVAAYTLVWGGLGPTDNIDNVFNSQVNITKLSNVSDTQIINISGTIIKKEITHEDVRIFSKIPVEIFWKGIFLIFNFLVIFYLVWYSNIKLKTCCEKLGYYSLGFILLLFIISLRTITGILFCIITPVKSCTGYITYHSVQIVSIVGISILLIMLIVFMLSRLKIIFQNKE